MRRGREGDGGEFSLIIYFSLYIYRQEQQPVGSEATRKGAAGPFDKRK
jgi:hypothetical protein